MSGPSRSSPDLFLYCAERIENIRATLLDDLQAHGGIAVLHRQVLAIAAPHLDVRYVPQAHRTALRHARICSPRSCGE